MYHSIAKKPKGTVLRSIHVAPKRFAMHMRLLKLLGYTALSMRELMPYVRGEKSGKVVGLTFDDGYQNNLTHALPVLNKFGFSSTLYLVSNRLGQYNQWDESKHIEHNALMSVEEINTWLEQGQDIGAHTQHHVNLNAVPIKVAEQEIRLSKQQLEILFDRPVTDFCYPYGGYNQQIINICKQNGFDNATTIIRGRVTPNNTDPFELPRIFVPYHTLPHLFLMKLFTQYEDTRAK